METSSFSSTQLFQDFPGKFQSRKLFLDNHLNQQPVTAAAPPYPGESSSLHKSVVLILVAAVICSLGLNILIICALVKCRRFVAPESNANSSSPSVKSGIKKKSLKNFPVVKYSTELKLPGLDPECVICLSEFAAGERVRILPKCSHGFHVRCIDKWLKSHTSCPKCRHFLIETCEKIVGCSVDGTSGTSVPVQETVVSIRPLEPEGIIHNSGGLG